MLPIMFPQKTFGEVTEGSLPFAGAYLDAALAALECPECGALLPPIPCACPVCKLGIPRGTGLERGRMARYPSSRDVAAIQGDGGFQAQKQTPAQ